MILATFCITALWLESSCSKLEIWGKWETRAFFLDYVGRKLYVLFWGRYKIWFKTAFSQFFRIYSFNLHSKVENTKVPAFQKLSVEDTNPEFRSSFWCLSDTALEPTNLIKSQQRLSPEDLDKLGNQANRNCRIFKNCNVLRVGQSNVME